ncbi:MAG: hypothetical protein WDN28_27470 [Chthoniobacter sp.]
MAFRIRYAVFFDSLILAFLYRPAENDVASWMMLGSVLVVVLVALWVSVILAILVLSRGRAGKALAVVALLMAAPPLLFLSAVAVQVINQHLRA